MPPDLDFNRAEYGCGTSASHCSFCTRGLDGPYFEVQRERACQLCAEHARQISPADAPKTFWHAAVTGALAAAMAGLIYFLLFRASGGAWMAWAAIGVGYIIGRAMRLGSGGIGGRRYQITAALLTYVAVALGSSAALLGTDVPAWAWPFLVFAPFLQAILGHFSLAALQLLFCLIGIRWAWGLTAGAPLTITGPHPIG